MYIRFYIAVICSLIMTISSFALAETHEQPENQQPSVKQEDVATASPAKAVIKARAIKILPSDVRVLIDVSGSMKKTDPNNLRKPALDLIVRLLPDKSRAGVWIFGNEVNMLVPHNLVDADWRKQAAPKTHQINSVALYTNIGKALDQVSFDRKKLSTEFKTHIVLLTDGVVDISKQIADNTKERQRILNDILPSLKAAGYTIHTIALSENADVELLKKISQATDGIFTTAASADDLTNTFLKIFDQAVPAERVPLDANGFLVDASVKEFTALIFRKPSVEKTIIVAPDGKEYSSTSPQDGVNWYRTDKYDLITADTPKAGQWKIKTDITPQSRITVVSNLKLMMQPLKNNMYINDSLAFNYSFQEDEKTVINKEFLGLLAVTAIISKTGTEENETLEFTMPTLPTDGVFHQTTNTFSRAGDYQVNIYVDGKTFKREFKHSFSVRESLMSVSKNNTSAENGKITYSYKITTDEKAVDPNSLQVTIGVRDSINNNVEKTLTLTSDKHWEFSFSPTQTADYRVTIHAQGEMLDGSELDETINAETFSYTAQTQDEKPAEHSAADISHETEKPKSVEVPPAEQSNLLLYISIGVGNLLIAVLGYFGYKMVFGSKKNNEIADVESLLAVDVKSVVASTAVATAEKKNPDKMEIDLSDENPAYIPMNDESSMDNLFPLDSMEEADKNDDDE